MSSTTRSGKIWPQVVTAVIVVALLVMLVLALRLHQKGEGGSRISKDVNNCRQILVLLRLYAADEGGRYPDSAVPLAKDSNTVFRQFLVAGVLEDERIFGCDKSPFVPDGDVGEKPNFLRAVEPGENHWAMTKGLNDKSPGGVPLVYENPAEATWPPTWNADAGGMMVKGRSWSGGKVIIGTNDTSVQFMNLASPKRGKVPLKSLGDQGLDSFTQWSQSRDVATYSILDVLWDENVILSRLAAYNREQSLAGFLRTGAIVAVLALLVLGCWKFKRSRASTASFVH